MKKIYAQHKVFDTLADEGCELFNLPLVGKQSKINRFVTYLCNKNAFDISAIRIKHYNFIYIRRIMPNCLAVIKLLKFLKDNNPSCKIVYELPTYPYDFEHASLNSKVALVIDKVYRKSLHRYVDKIATLTDDEEIFGCKTLKISNGVDCNLISVCKKTTYDSQRINLIAVAQFSFWHGYERVIEGLHNYGKNNVVLHLVGNGPELERYKRLVAEYCLEEQVMFYGALSGDKLTSVFDTADIALGSLACHKINIYIASELKSREYLCRGLPIVTSTKIDIIPDDFRYSLRVPEDDTPLDVQKIVDFANSLYNSNERDEICINIRKFAEQNCSMERAMKTVTNYFNI